MTVDDEEVTVSLLSVTAVEEGENDEFTITVITDGAGYAIPDVSSSLE